MPFPKLRTDFNTTSLANHWAQEDLRRQGITLKEGMRMIVYDLDQVDGQHGFTHAMGSVWWDAKARVFRIDRGAIRFTPGSNPALLDAEYAGKAPPAP